MRDVRALQIMNFIVYCLAIFIIKCKMYFLIIQQYVIEE